MNQNLKKRKKSEMTFQNGVCRDEIQRIKAGNPDISHREAFSAAAKNVRSKRIFIFILYIYKTLIVIEWNWNRVWVARVWFVFKIKLLLLYIMFFDLCSEFVVLCCIAVGPLPSHSFRTYA